MLWKVDVGSLVACQQRRLVFVKAPLEEVSVELNRFNRRPIRLDSGHGGVRHHSGTFGAGDPQALIAFLGKETDLKVTVGEDEIRVSPRASPDAAARWPG